MLLILENIFRFILLILLQVLILNNVQFFGYLSPYAYILFIIALPLQTPRWFSLLLAMVIGLTIDAFDNTMGMHAFATVFVAFLRNGIIKMFVNIEDTTSATPSFHSLGLGAYIKYTIVIVLLHHTLLFFLEAFSLVSFWLIIPKVFVSSFVSTAIVLSIQAFNDRKKKL